MSIKNFRYLNGVARKYKNRKVSLVQSEDRSRYLLEILNYTPELAHFPCVNHSVLRDKVAVSAIGLSRLSLISTAISIMDILGAETKANLLELEESASLKLRNKFHKEQEPSFLFLRWYYAQDLLRNAAFLSLPTSITKPNDAELNPDEWILFDAFADLSTYTAKECLNLITAECDKVGVSVMVALNHHNLPYEQSFRDSGFEGAETLDKTKDYLIRKPKK